MRRYRIQLAIVFLLLIVGGIVLPLHQVHAFPGVDTLLLTTVIPGLYIVREVIGTQIGLIGNALAMLTGINTYIAQPVRDIWKIVRNLCNMFFILILIIMAFGTIFNIHGYTFRDMFIHFLIAALLINFSLTISEYIL